jgi:NitT/TauT family transport system substrate-binding protein
VQALTNALYKALVWINKATPEEISAVVPPEYLLGDKDLYILAVKNSKPTYSQNGIVSAAGMKSTNDMLVQFDEEMKNAKIDLSKTFDDRFAKKAAETIK